MKLFKQKLKRYLINRLPISNAIDDENLSPFFIIGSGRNGSTLLAAILNNHPDIFIPPEQYALPHLTFNWQYKLYSSREKKLKSNINIFLGKSYHWKINSRETYTFIDERLKDNASFPVFLSLFYQLEATKTAKQFSLWGDKTPYNTFYVPLISKLYPKAKFIFLNRDPRDVAASMKKMFPLMSIDEIIYRWEYSFKSLLHLQKGKKAVYFCQYENFVQNPKTHIAAIQFFLGAKKEANILINYDTKVATLGVANAIQHSNIYKPINTDSIGTYQSLLQADEIKLIENKLKKYL